MYEYETRKLSFQLVPSTCWYTNLRSILPNWPEISYNVRLNHTCDICGSRLGPFDAHEIWDYDDISHIQSLKNIICVCKDCHNVIHIGHAQIEGTAEQAYEWYIKVNNLTEDQADRDIKEAFYIWEKRSQYNWKLYKDDLIKKTEELTGIKCDLEDPINNKYYANVSYKDKEIAKKYGARWDNNRKLWYFSSAEKRNKYIKRN